MTVIQATDMTDELWIIFAKADEFLKKEIYTEEWDGKDTHWRELKKKTLDSLQISETAYSNYYYFFKDKKAVAYIDAFERRGNLYFVFNEFKKIISEEVLRLVLDRIYKLMIERNKDEAFFYTFYERHYEPVLSTGVEIHEETLTSMLLKKDINFSDLEKIVESNKFAGSYELKLFHEIPEEIYDRFVNYMNEVIIDSNFYHPKKKVMKEYTMKDLLERVEDIKNDNCPFYLYMLFDNNIIVAHCAVFIDVDSKSNTHWIDHVGAGYTAVGRNDRGKNLAKYLKAKMYIKIQEDYPDFRYILTDTFMWNKHMYRINDEFGFKPHQKGYTFRFTREFLKHYLK